MNLMVTRFQSLQQGASRKPSYANALRCIGQSLESMGLKALEVKTQGDSYIVQAWNKWSSSSKDFERHYTLADIKKLETEGREKRKFFPEPPNLLSLSQVLRLAGNYVDRMCGCLLRVSWQDQSEKIQSITIQYEPFHSDRNEQAESCTSTIEELCIHVYKQRKRITTASDKHPHKLAPGQSIGH